MMFEKFASVAIWKVYDVTCSSALLQVNVAVFEIEAPLDGDSNWANGASVKEEILKVKISLSVAILPVS